MLASGLALLLDYLLILLPGLMLCALRFGVAAAIAAHATTILLIATRSARRNTGATL